MNVVLTLLFGLLGKLPGVFGDYFSKQADLANANIELQKEIVKAQIIQAGEMARAQLEYQTAALHATMPLFKQHMFWFLSVPILITMFMPTYAAVLWANVRLIPEFYWTLYSAVVLTIWGIPVASNLVSSVFSGFSSYTADKRADKIEMQRVSGEQYKLALFNEWRKTHGPLNQKEVDSLNKALDNLGGPEK